ncbi:MAG: hypothetical protein KIS85_07745 [Anaerolineales bacterium]|nr:hypothetical protein [Anaerolineales bacterium]
MKILNIMLTALLVSSCAPVAPSLSPTQQIETAVAFLATEQASQDASRNLEAQSSPSLIVEPSQTPEVIQTTIPIAEVRGEVFALNYLGSLTSGGLEIEIARVLIGNKAYIVTETGNDFDSVEIFQDKPVVGMIIFRVTNHTNQVLTVYPDQADVVVGNEQISLTDYLFYATFGDDIGGDIFPGVTAIGGIWFGLRRTSVDDANQMIIRISAPRDQSSRVGEEYYFTLDISNHIFEEIPQELK